MAVMFRVFKVQQIIRHALGPTIEQNHWRVAPPVANAHPGDDVEISVVDPGLYKIEAFSKAFEKNPVEPSGKKVTARISEDVEKPKYHEFEIYINGQFVEANSAPGMIID